MSIEENKAILRRASEEFIEGNLAAIDELIDEFYAADYVAHLPGGVEVRGREGQKQGITGLLSAFPDYHDTVEDLIAEGDRVVVRLTWTGTHQGQLGRIAPTSKQVTSTANNIYRIVGGRIVEAWIMSDNLGMMQQLGVIPAPGQG